jgi:MFS family permease
MRLCALVAIGGGLLLPLLANMPVPLLVTLFLWGGVTVSLYPVALSMVGDRFAGAELVAGNAALIMLYGIGSLVGPAIAGVAMDLWNPHGLPLTIAMIFLAFLIMTGLPPRDAATK